MKKSSVLIFLGILFSILLYGCFQRLVAYDGTYRGRIVDAETGEPLEGIVALGVWYTETPSVGGGVMSYYDAREAVTDKNGDFSIPGQGLKVATNLLPMRPIIFKAGYAYLQFFWDKESLNDERACGATVTWDGKIPVIPLRELSPEERKKITFSPPSPPSDAPYEKVRFYLKERNKDRIERGLKPLTEWGGVKYYEENNGN
jgi:hypothetical protein